MKVGDLKNLLSDILETLEDYEDGQELELQGNSYFTRHHNNVLQTRSGFLGLDNIREMIEGEEEEGY
jgi:hypothetical protein